MFGHGRKVWLLSLFVTAVLTAGCLGLPFRSHDLTIAVQGEGTVTPALGAHRVRHDTLQDLTAEPAAGWQFVKWIIEDDGSGGEIEDSETAIHVDRDLLVTAVFTKIDEPPPDNEPKSYTLTVTALGGGTVTPDIGTHDFSAGKVVELKAEPGEDCTFEGWFITGADGTVELAEKEISITMTEDKEVKAVFSKRGCPAQTVSHVLTVEARGEGTVTPKAGTHTFEEDQEVSLQAEPAAGWNFVHWIVVDKAGTKEYEEREIHLKMASAVKATAVFAKPIIPPTSYTLTVSKEGEGTVTPIVGTHELSESEQTELQAAPAEGWEFVKWVIEDESGTTQLQDKNIFLTMDGNKTALALFAETVPVTSYILNVSREGEGTVTPIVGAHEFLENEQAELTADPAEGWEFVKWVIESEGEITELAEQNITLAMDGNKAVKAEFSKADEPIPATHTLTVKVVGQGSADIGEGDHQFPEDTWAWVTAEPGDGFELVGWLIESTAGLTERIHGHGSWEPDAESHRVWMDEDKKITVFFADEFSEITLEAEYEVDSYPNEDPTLITTNQTSVDMLRRNLTEQVVYPVGYPIRLKAFSGKRSDTPALHDRFEGWRIKSAETGEELNPADHFLDYKDPETSLITPGESVIITAEWIRFARIFSSDFRTAHFDEKGEEAKHFIDLTALPTGTELSFLFNPQWDPPIRYKVYYGTWEDVVSESALNLLFDTGWIALNPSAVPDHTPYGKIERIDWHENVILRDFQAIYPGLIEKRSDYDYLLIVVDRKNYPHIAWRYWLYLASLD